MSKAHAGHIIVKGDSQKGRPAKQDPFSIRRFFTPVDKGAARPAFCYKGKIQRFKEEVDSMEKAIDNGMVDDSRKEELRFKLNQRKERLDQLMASKDRAAKIIKKDPDGWKARYNELAEKISNGMPTRKDVKDRRVNPYQNLRREKKEGLEDMKREYQIIGRALTETTGEHHETNVGFLQKDS